MDQSLVPVVISERDTVNHVTDILTLCSILTCKKVILLLRFTTKMYPNKLYDTQVFDPFELF